MATLCEAVTPQSVNLRGNGRLLQRALALPFDALRSLHARAVHVGLIQRSMLSNARFEHFLDALERSTLGPLARRV